VDEVTDEPLYRDRVCGIDIGKAELYATIRVPSDSNPARRASETRRFAATRRGVLALADWLRCWQVPAAVIFVRTQRVPKDCVAIGRRRIVVLDFRYGALGFVAIPVVSCDADHVGGHSGRRPLACWTAWTTRLRLASSSPVRASRRSTG